MNQDIDFDDNDSSLGDFTLTPKRRSPISNLSCASAKRAKGEGRQRMFGNTKGDPLRWEILSRAVSKEEYANLIVNTKQAYTLKQGKRSLLDKVEVRRLSTNKPLEKKILPLSH